VFAPLSLPADFFILEPECLVKRTSPPKAAHRLRRGLTPPSALKVEVKRVAMQSASQVVLVASSSKYGIYSSKACEHLRNNLLKQQIEAP
jgi:hypothetical protein